MRVELMPMFDAHDLQAMAVVKQDDIVAIYYGINGRQIVRLIVDGDQSALAYFNPVATIKSKIEVMSGYRIPEWRLGGFVEWCTFVSGLRSVRTLEDIVDLGEVAGNEPAFKQILMDTLATIAGQDLDVLDGKVSDLMRVGNAITAHLGRKFPFYGLAVRDQNGIRQSIAMAGSVRDAEMRSLGVVRRHLYQAFMPILSDPEVGDNKLVIQKPKLIDFGDGDVSFHDKIEAANTLKEFYDNGCSCGTFSKAERTKGLKVLKLA